MFKSEKTHYRTCWQDVNDIKGWRRLSVRECARLQSFPDNFVLPVSASSAYKAIGNAVPPVMAWNIARAVLATLQTIESNNQNKGYILTVHIL